MNNIKVMNNKNVKIMIESLLDILHLQTVDVEIRLPMSLSFVPSKINNIRNINVYIQINKMKDKNGEIIYKLWNHNHDYDSTIYYMDDILLDNLIKNIDIMEKEIGIVDHIVFQSSDKIIINIGLN